MIDLNFIKNLGYNSYSYFASDNHLYMNLKLLFDCSFAIRPFYLKALILLASPTVIISLAWLQLLLLADHHLMPIVQTSMQYQFRT